jgi:hypothetical protein
MGLGPRASTLRLLGIVGLVLAMPAFLAAQLPTDGAHAWTPPRTPDGRPDLQGTWISKTATPLERPKELEGKARLTDEEVARLKARAERLFGAGQSDFAAGDNFFLAALSNPDRFKNPNATHGSEEMIERDFDHRTSLVVNPPDGRIPPVVEAGQKRREAAAAAIERGAGPEDFSNANRCIAWGAPRLGGRYGAGDLGYYQIVQTPGYVVLYMETGHEARIVPVDGRPHVPNSVRQWSGDSTGRWDGDTLVIDTGNFSSKSDFMGAAEGLHVVERLTRVGPDTIRYEMTLTDPATWSAPWSAEMPLRLTTEPLYESACHEGNYEIMRGLLSAARAQNDLAFARQK